MNGSAITCKGGQQTVECIARNCMYLHILSRICSYLQINFFCGATIGGRSIARRVGGPECRSRSGFDASRSDLDESAAIKPNQTKSNREA